ncbi:hypothetical protein BOTBODRAFT_473162 [Botryobasidium botryosum FD-172 SS1]|uniref:Uncharacterized protein n=1 Tax=Botryobasidium botryosum (strain FD-172 SS1) TaxID=930990 RepID=A0A067M4R7_BOTB1|nr:hypothetical protein BOTBODRAFT_473162 [Botryobasidium botryosum FD-172 SS1]
MRIHSDTYVSISAAQLECIPPRLLNTPHRRWTHDQLPVILHIMSRRVATKCRMRHYDQALTLVQMIIYVACRAGTRAHSLMELCLDDALGSELGTTGPATYTSARTPSTFHFRWQHSYVSNSGALRPIACGCPASTRKLHCIHRSTSRPNTTNTRPALGRK